MTLEVFALAFLLFICLLTSPLSISDNMACIEKIILAFVIVQVSAVALAKPHKPGIDDGLYRSNDDIKGFIYKRGKGSLGFGK